MKRLNSLPEMTGKCRYLWVFVFLTCLWPLSGQTVLYGPEYPPPKDYSIQPSLNTSDGQLGRAGGRTFTISNITLANTTDVFWSIYANEVMLSMDGESYAPNEIMSIDGANTDLAGGLVYWTGSTYMPFNAGGGISLHTRLVITVTNNDGSPLALTDPVALGLDPGCGGAAPVSDHLMIFKIKLELFVSENGSTWTPHLVYYESHDHVPGIMAYYSIDFGFWWENDPPVLTMNDGASVNEGDTLLINKGALSAGDLEDGDPGILFILNPGDGPVLPAHGALFLNDAPLASDDTLTQENLVMDKVSYIHDGSETLKDSIAFAVSDTRGAYCKIDGDSIFHFRVTITPQDDIPVVEINLPITLDEGTEMLITADYLQASDAESSPDRITYTIDVQHLDGYPEWGELKKGELPLDNGETFTQADITAGLISYEHDGSEAFSDKFGFTVEDEFAHRAINPNADPVLGPEIFLFDITINPVNDAPRLTKLMTLEMDEGGIGNINNGVLAASDDDNETDEILFTLDPNSEIGNPWCGDVTLDGTVLGDGEYFSMEDINSGKVKFVHDGSETYTEIFGFRLSDNAGAIYYDGPWDVFHFNILINPVNDPPVVQNPIPDFNIAATQNWTYSFADDVFHDPDPEDELSFRVEKLDQGDLPAWISFTSGTRSFVADPTADDHGELVIVVIARDLAMEAARDTFMLYVYGVGTELAEGQDVISVYPNPFTEQITLNIPESLVDAGSIAVYNTIGEQVYLDRDPGPGENNIRLEELPAGLYILQVHLGNEKVYKKLYKGQ